MQGKHRIGFDEFISHRKPTRENFDRYLLPEIAQRNETMRNLAVVSGALTTGVLILLSSDIQVSVGLAICSVAFFGFVTCISIHELVAKHKANFREIYDYKEQVLDLMDKMNLAYFQYFKGELSEQALEAKIEEYNKNDMNTSIKAIERQLTEGHKDTPIHEVMIYLLWGGIVALIISLLLPYVVVGLVFY